MTDDELRWAYGALREQRQTARDEPGAGPRPNPDALWSALAGELEPGERVRILDEALRAGGSDDVALVHSMRSAALTATAPAATGKATGTRRRWWAMAAAAALLVTVSVPVLRRDGRSVATAGDTTGGDRVRYREGGRAALALVAPANDTPLSEQMVFTWHPVGDAQSYTVEALDAEGRVVTRMTTTDSTVSLPTSLTAEERQRITGWWVTATSRDGRIARSELRLVAPAQRP